MVKIPREADRSFSDFRIGIERWNLILLWIRIAETKEREKHNKTTTTKKRFLEEVKLFFSVR